MRLAAAFLAGAALTALVLRDGSPTPRAGRERASPGREPMGAFETTPEDERWMRDALEKERERRDNARVRPGDGGLDVVERREEWGAGVGALVRDFDRFVAHIRPSSAAPVLVEATGEITEVGSDDPRLDAEVVEFGPGRFVIDSRGWKTDVDHLEIRGAGMDHTVLAPRYGTLLSIPRPLPDLVIRDLAFEPGDRGRGFLFIRTTASVLLERVRLRRWHGNAIHVAGAAYLAARDCEFLGEFHDRGRSHHALQLSGTGLASFERCLFADLFATVGTTRGVAAQSVVHFEDCTWENAPVFGTGALGYRESMIPITVRGGTVHAESAEAWGASRVASIEDVAFEPRIPRCRLADLMGVVRAIEPGLEDGRRFMGVKVLAVNQDAAREFVVWIRNSDAYRQKNRVADVTEERYVTIENGAPRAWPHDRRRRLPNYGSGWSDRRGAGVRSITELVNGARLDPSREAYELRLGTTSHEGEVVPVLEARWYSPFRRVLARVHAVTGERLADGS